MTDDKAIRAAKLTLGGILEKNRAKQAKERAPGQIAPSKYMPNVPRAVHAFGGYVPAPMVQNAPRLAVAKAPRQAPQQEADFLASMQSLTDTAKSFTGKEEAPATAPEPHAARAEPHGYGEGISSDAAKAMAGLQGAWGGQEFGIVSGYRDPKENEAAKGAKNSQHLHGNAFDVDTTGWSEEDKLALADAAWEQGFRGFGFYDNNMHFDVGDPRGWGPSYSRDSIPSWAQDWTANRYGYAEGGEIADLGQAREQKQIKQFHTGLMGDVKTGMNNAMEAHQKALDAGVFEGYEVGDVLQGSAHPMKITGRFMRKWKPSSMTLQSFDRMGAKPTIIEHEDTQYIPMLRYETGLEGTEGWQSGDAYLDGVKAAGYKKMGGLRSVKADGGPIMTQEQIEREMPSQPGGGQKAQDALDAVSKAGRIGGLVGRASGVPLGNIVGRKIAEQIAMSGYADGGPIGDAPDIQNPMSIFPKPQRMFPEDQRPPGGQYLSMPNKSDVTGHKAETAHIGVGLDGKPFFRASQNAVDQTGSTGSGTANVKTNLFKQKAGWRWSQAPEGHENTQTIVSVEHRGKHYYALNAHFPKGVDLARYENATSEPRLRPTTRGNVDLGPQAGSITVRGREHPVYHHVIVKADGGAVERASGGRIVTDHGLYSRAAEIIRGLPQEKGTVEQYIAAAKKLGAKPSEIEHAGRPEGDKISREDMAKHFDKNLPKMEVHQYGENPSYLSKEQEKRLYEMWNKPKSEAEQAEYDLLMRRTKGPQVKYENAEYNDENEPRPTEYQDYTIPGGSNYRERLLTLPSTDGKNDYMSNHWSDDSNVLAHIRMSDRTMGGDRESLRPAMQKLADHMGVGIRDLGAGSAELGVNRGVISPEEAASISRLMRWSGSPYYNKPGLDKRVLHVEEMQSDWGQEGKKKGFYDPKNPYEIFNNTTGEVVSKHPSNSEMLDAHDRIPEDQAGAFGYGYAKYRGKRPAAPYVQNTQHWTDLALKNILHEAAMGNYDHVVFTPGQAQAQRYGLRDSGEGMKGYYDNILPKSVMRLAQQHDEDIKPGSMELPEGHTGFSIPMTDKLKQGVLGGQTAFKRGGTVDVEKALGITRSFTKDGKAATMRLKLKE